MKFLSDILAKAGLTVDGVVTLNNTATGQTPATNDNSTKLATTAFIKNQSYLSANQTITVSGDATGSGTTSIILTLANSGVTAGVYGNASNIPTITVDAKGRITSISTNAVSIVTTLAGLSDVTLTSPSANQVLQYNGTQWVNGAAPTTYTLPIATSSILGGIKVGTGLSIDPATGILTTSGGAGGNLNFRIIQEFTATAGQTTYTISGGYNVGYVEVLINGVYISENQYTATNGTTIVLNDASTAGDIVTVFLYSLYNLGTSVYARNVDTLTATAGQTSFSTSYIVGQIDVYYNGSKLTAAEYTATTGSSIVLVQAAVSGDIIEVVTYLAGAGINASRTLTINGTTYDLTANRTWTLTTANISEVTNLYYTDARARAAISESVTGLDYNSATGVLSITTGYGIPTTASQTTWDAAYNDKINSAAVTGTTTKTLTLTQQDGGTITASWTDDNTDAVTSVFGRTGAVVATSGDYTTALVTEVTNLYYTDARARAAISVTGSGSYDSATGIITVTGGVTSVNTLTGAVTLTTTNIGEGTNLYYTTARANSDFDTRLGTKSTTNLAEGTNLYYTTARANSDFDTRLATKSTTNLAEGTNLYYTDTRVGTYLTGNSYATQSYVSTQINNLVSGAPGLLDTLDELAAALGDDPNFATTVSTALGNRLRIDIGTQGLTGTQQGYGRTNLGLGSLSTLSSIGDAYITDLAYSKLTGVPSTFAPSAHTHDDRYYTETEIGNFFSGASAITGYNKTNWDTAYGWGNHASGGYLTTASAASTYVSLSGSYANPSWITSLAYSKITGVPAFITSYTETDTLASVTGRGASTSTALTLSGGITVTGLTIAKSAGISTITFPAGTNDPAFISHTESTANTGIMRFSVGDDNDTVDYFVFGNTVNPDAFRINANGTISIGTWQGTAIADSYISSAATWNAKQAALSGTGFVKITGTTISYDNSTYYLASNPSGYISSYTETDTLSSVVARGSSTTSAISAANFQVASQALNLDTVKTPGLYHYDGAYTGTQPIQNWYNVRTIEIGNSTRASQFVMPYNVDRIFYRRNTDPGWQGYVELYHTGNLPTIPTNNNQLTNGAGYLTSVTTITGNAGSATLLKSINTTTSVLSNWNPQSLTYQAWGQAWTHSSIGGDSGDMVLWLRAGQYSAGGTEVCMMIDGDYYAGSGAQKVWHAGNLTNNNQLTNGAGYITSSGSISGNAATANSATNAVYLGTNDLRTIAPNSHDAYKLRFGFTSYNNNNTAPWADYLHLRSYGDGSGGSDNLVMFLKSGIGMRIWQQSFGSATAYSSYADVLHSSNYSSYALPLSGGTVTGDTNFGPDSGGDNGIRIRYGNINGGYGRIRFHQDGTNHNTIHSFAASWQGGSFIGASAGALNIAGQYGVTFGGWNTADAHINTDGIYVKAWATPVSSRGWNANSVLRLQQGSLGDNVYIEMRNRGDSGDHAAILFTDNNVGGYIGFRTYAANNVTAGSDCMIYGTYNDHIFQNGSSETFNGKTETFRIYANGSVRATGDITAYSDRRVKENIITIDKALEKTLQLRGVFYNRTDKDDKSQKVGVIAQEIQEILPQVVNEDYNGLLSVSYGNITGLLIEAVKELKAENDALKEILKRNNII